MKCSAISVNRQQMEKAVPALVSAERHRGWCEPGISKRFLNITPEQQTLKQIVDLRTDHKE